MICEKCEELGGFEGDPPSYADYFVKVVAPAAEAEANPGEYLCGNHAGQAAEAYLGFGWAIHADLLTEYERRWYSSLIERGTNTSPTGG